MNFIILLFFIQIVNAHILDNGQFEITNTNFSDLYNRYRYASPEIVPWAGNFFPYSEQGTAVKLDASGEPFKHGRSPMESYEFISQNFNQAYNWEIEHHNCKNYEGKTKKSCEAWWGHCNGWAAAAIKEKEPRNSKLVGGQEISVADQKGILSELWLASYSLNAGLTDKDSKTRNWIHDHHLNDDRYKKFWDITPKAFFLILTNYIGAMKTGVVIDRFTGDEVWNQPLVGYRMLPIGSQDISKIQEGGKTYWSMKIQIKIFWANDIGLSHGHLSKPFEIEKIFDVPEVDSLPEDYEGRYLSFRLFFDREVRVSSDGKKIISAGKIIGDGIWSHQENSKSFTFEELNHSHPDFLWIPTEVYADQSGYGNPYMDVKTVQELMYGENITHQNAGPVKLKMIFDKKIFNQIPLEAEMIKRKVQSVLRRDAIKHVIYLSDITNTIDAFEVSIYFPFRVEPDYLMKLFQSAKLPFRF